MEHLNFLNQNCLFSLFTFVSFKIIQCQNSLKMNKHSLEKALEYVISFCLMHGSIVICLRLAGFVFYFGPY